MAISEGRKRFFDLYPVIHSIGTESSNGLFWLQFRRGGFVTAEVSGEIYDIVGPHNPGRADLLSRYIQEKPENKEAFRRLYAEAEGFKLYEEVDIIAEGSNHGTT